MTRPDEEVQADENTDTTPIERTNAYRAGFMNGYTADNPNSDPSVAGYMDGYFNQRKGGKPEQEGDDE